MRNIEAEADARRAIVREARDRRIAERIEWPDDTAPRTDAPVRFSRGLHQYESLQYGQLRATFRFSPSFIAR